MKVCDKTCIFFFFPIINKYFLMAKRSLLSRCPSYKLTAFVDGIIVNLQCVFRLNRSTTDHKFCFRQIVENEIDKGGKSFNCLLTFKRACGCVKRAVLFNISFSFVLQFNCLGYNKCH